MWVRGTGSPRLWWSGPDECGDVVKAWEWTRFICCSYVLDDSQRFCPLGFRGLCHGWYLFSNREEKREGIREEKRRCSSASDASVIARDPESKQPYLPSGSAAREFGLAEGEGHSDLYLYTLYKYKLISDQSVSESIRI